MTGQQLESIGAIWEEMFSRSNQYPAFRPDERRAFVHAVGALDTALWDTLGKVIDAPLYKMWGAHRDSLPVVGIGGYYVERSDDEELINEMHSLEEMGYQGVKIRVGAQSVSEDISRLRAVEEQTEEDFLIGCDANQGYTIQQALEFASAASEHGIDWFEEPVVWYDQYRGMREIRQKTGVTVTAGQSEISPSGCLRLVDAGAVDRLNYDASWGGGPTAWLRVATAANLEGVDMCHHEEPHIAMHLLASIPNATYVEAFPPQLDPVFHEMVRNPPTIERGRLTLPDRPGIGLELDPEFIATHRVQL